ncbi:peptidase M48, Ste24p domain protein [Burkholderia cepacia]|nr:peptidase M48, Ste24p domain protein [Burkholderia cepacia]
MHPGSLDSFIWERRFCIIRQKITRCLHRMTRSLLGKLERSGAPARD